MSDRVENRERPAGFVPVHPAGAGDLIGLPVIGQIGILISQRYQFIRGAGLHKTAFIEQEIVKGEAEFRLQIV